jgi:5-hydroxyisourate hydrolase
MVLRCDRLSVRRGRLWWTVLVDSDDIGPDIFQPRLNLHLHLHLTSPPPPPRPLCSCPSNTDNDGRVTTLLKPTTQLQAGVYKMRFEVGDYFQAQGVQAFYPFVEITFNLANPGQHYHIPLLLAPFSYSTYRGS